MRCWRACSAPCASLTVRAIAAAQLWYVRIILSFLCLANVAAPGPGLRSHQGTVFLMSGIVSTRRGDHLRCVGFGVSGILNCRPVLPPLKPSLLPLPSSSYALAIFAIPAAAAFAAGHTVAGPAAAAAAAGRDDPWVVPIWGQRLKRQLPAATYLELAPAGHCPHHEAPIAINSIIETYVAAVEVGQHTHNLLQVRSRGWLLGGGGRR